MKEGLRASTISSLGRSAITSPSFVPKIPSGISNFRMVPFIPKAPIASAAPIPSAKLSHKPFFPVNESPSPVSIFKDPSFRIIRPARPAALIEVAKPRAQSLLSAPKYRPNSVEIPNFQPGAKINSETKVIWKNPDLNIPSQSASRRELVHAVKPKNRIAFPVKPHARAISRHLESSNKVQPEVITKFETPATTPTPEGKKQPKPILEKILPKSLEGKVSPQAKLRLKSLNSTLEQLSTTQPAEILKIVENLISLPVPKLAEVVKTITNLSLKTTPNSPTAPEAKMVSINEQAADLSFALKTYQSLKTAGFPQSEAERLIQPKLSTQLAKLVFKDRTEPSNQALPQTAVNDEGARKLILVKIKAEIRKTINLNSTETTFIYQRAEAVNQARIEAFSDAAKYLETQSLEQTEDGQEKVVDPTQVADMVSEDRNLTSPIIKSGPDGSLVLTKYSLHSLDKLPFSQLLQAIRYAVHSNTAVEATEVQTTKQAHHSEVEKVLNGFYYQDELYALYLFLKSQTSNTIIDTQTRFSGSNIAIHDNSKLAA